jgi:cytochrome c-type biogenesis protein CcmE
VGHAVERGAGPGSAVIRPARGRLALATVVLTGTGLLAYGGLRGTLTYYRTPAEVRTDPDAQHSRTRLSGAVVPGSVRHEGMQTVFRLAADGQQITVRQQGTPPGTFREGQDAVVEGVLGPDGVFRSDQVLVRHGNEYRPAGADPSSGTAG